MIGDKKAARIKRLEERKARGEKPDETNRTRMEDRPPAGIAPLSEKMKEIFRKAGWRE